MNLNRSFVPELGMYYEFKNGKLVFEDGVTYDPAEAIVMAKDRLEEVDIQAIHLVKRMLDGTIVEVIDRQDKKKIVITQEELPLDPPRSSRFQTQFDLDSLGESFGELPKIDER